MKKLLLTALFAGLSVSTVMPFKSEKTGLEYYVDRDYRLKVFPVNREEKDKDWYYIDCLYTAIGGLYGASVGHSLGAAVDEVIADEHFNFLRQQYKNRPRYISKVADLEFKRATTFVFRRAALKSVGTAVAAVGGCAIGHSLYEMVRDVATRYGETLVKHQSSFKQSLEDKQKCAQKSIDGCAQRVQQSLEKFEASDVDNYLETHRIF